MKLKNRQNLYFNLLFL